MNLREIPPIFKSPGGRESISKTILALQLFADGIERIDINLLEIRHLQTNLIYSMRLPDLQRVLRFEEGFLFGGAEIFRGPINGLRTENIPWGEVFSTFPIDANRSEILAHVSELFVPEIPRADSGNYRSPAGHGRPYSTIHLDEAAKWFHFDHQAHMRDVIAPITRELRRRFLQGDWDDAFNNSFELFQSLQLLKREAVLNKLHLADVALDVFATKEVMDAPRDAGKNKFAFEKFHFIRGVCLANASRIVERLADIHAQFEKALDIGSQENHRPITGRRREQGVYNFVLSERAHETVEQATRLVSRLLDLSSDRHNELFRDMPPIIHRWLHSYTSENAEILSSSRTDAIRNAQRADVIRDAQKSKFNGEIVRKNLGKTPYFGAYALNTQFYMPDRTDLQSVMAHEASHIIILEALGDLAHPPDDIREFGGPLATFLEHLIKIADVYDDEENAEVYDESDKHHRMQLFISEVLADLTAVSISGPAYLFALFEELFGRDLDHLAGRREQREWRDLERARERINTRFGEAPARIGWYTRIMLCCEVLRHAPRPTEDTAFTQTLIEGIKHNCEDMLEFLQSRPEFRRTIPTGNEEKRFERAAEALHFSGLLDHLKKLRTELQPDEEDPETSQTSYARFPVYVNRRLKECFIEKKAAQNSRILSQVLAPLRLETKEETALASDFLDQIHATDTGKRVLNFKYSEPTRALEEIHLMARRVAYVAADAILVFGATYSGLKSPQSFNGPGHRALIAAHQGEISKLQIKVQDPTLPASEHKDLKAAIKNHEKKQRAALDQMLDQIPIFERLGDISWQSSLIRSAELVHTLRHPENAPNGAATRFCLIETLSADFDPGRETLQLGIELWCHDRRRSVIDLTEAVRQTRNILGEPDTELGAAIVGPRDPAACPVVEFAPTALLNDLHSSIDRLEEIYTRKLPGFAHRKKGLKKLRDALQVWLGSAADADFVDPNFSDRIARINPTATMGDTEDTKKWHRLLRKEAIRTLNGNVTVALRLFEVEVQHDLNTKFAETSADQIFANHDRRKLGALQTLKLSSDYPWTNYGYSAADALALVVERPGQDWTMPRRDRAQQNKFRAYSSEADLPEDAKAFRDLLRLTDPENAEAHWRQILDAPFEHKGRIVTPFRPIVWFLSNPEINKGDIAQDAWDKHLDLHARIVAKEAHEFLQSRLAAQWAIDPTLCLNIIKQACKDVETGDPDDLFDRLVVPHRRRMEHPERNKKLEQLCRLKLAELSDLLDQVPNTLSFGPLRALLDQAKEDGKNKTVKTVFSGLSAPTKGLHVFRSFGISRLSLINSHWWRNSMGPDRDSWDPPNKSCATSPEISELKELWERENEEHAALFYELPTSGDGDRCDEPGPSVRRFATLGRYDYFNIGPNSGVFQIRQPIMDPEHSEIRSEGFSTPGAPFSSVRKERWFEAYFERREKAVQLSLLENPVGLTLPALASSRDFFGDPGAQSLPHSIGTNHRDVMCFISVRLSRRSNRLGFVRRLREAAKSWKLYRDGAKDDPDLNFPDIDWAAKEANNWKSKAWRSQVGLRLIDALAVNIGDEMARRLAPHLVDGTNKPAPDAALLEKFGTLGKNPIKPNLKNLFDIVRTYGDLPDLPIEATGPFLKSGDSVFLGEGWGDIFFALVCEMPDGTDAGDLKGHRRLFDVFALQHALFQDPEVYRTEMFLRPVALKFADYQGVDAKEFLRPNERFQITQAIRTREDRELGGMIQRMSRAIRQTFKGELPDPNISLSHIPGRNDLEFSIHDLSKLKFPATVEPNGKKLRDLTPSMALGTLHNMVAANKESAGRSSEEIITRLGFSHFLVPKRDQK